MKYLIIIATLLGVSLSKLTAQEKAPVVLTEISNLNEIHIKEFKVQTKENLEIDLDITSENFENLNVYVFDRQKRILEERENLKEGENKLTFEMEKYDVYTVRITSDRPINLDLSLVQK